MTQILTTHQTDLATDVKRSRSANYAVKGYLYQFHKTIEEVLQLQAKERVTVEGREDIDIQKQNDLCLVQCKYHEEQKFSPSKLYKPVGEMIKHYLQNQAISTKYWLYAYFGENAPVEDKWITTAFLESSLSKVEQGKTATTHQLEEFFQRFEFCLGVQFDKLKAKIKSMLAREFSCSSTEVDDYYYNNAVAYVAGLAARKNIEKRSITKQIFKSNIDKKINLFDSWQRQLKGKAVYIKSITERLSNQGALQDTKKRVLFISQQLLDQSKHEFSVKQFLHELAIEYPLEGKLYNTKPWTVVIELPASKLKEVKIYLVKNTIYYNDGYEDILFCSRYFNDMPIINHNKREKITKISHSLKIISANTFKEKFLHIADIERNLHTFINTSPSSDDNQYFDDNDNIATYKLSALKNLTELIQILKNARN